MSVAEELDGACTVGHGVVMPFVGDDVPLCRLSRLGAQRNSEQTLVIHGRGKPALGRGEAYAALILLRTHPPFERECLLLLGKRTRKLQRLCACEVEASEWVVVADNEVTGLR